MRKLLAAAVLALALAGCTQVAEPPEPTDAELDAYIQQYQDQQWYAYGSPQMERPELQSVLVTSGNYTDVACGTGVSVVIEVNTGAVSVTTLPSSETALYECNTAQIPYPTNLGYYTPAQLGAVYDYFRDSLVPCLQAQGLHIAVAPTRDEFAGVAGSIPWDPYFELGADLPPSRAQLIRQQCPAMPDADFLDPR